MTLGHELPPALRHLVGEAWATRTHVEEISAVQFQRLAHHLRGLWAPARLIEVATRAVEEEGRHQVLCAELALAYGVDPGPRAQATPLAPGGWPVFEACVYSAVAHCCVAETESVATLTELLQGVGPAEVRNALMTIARDEVEHAQLGWAIVTWAAQQGSLAFVGQHLASMLEPGAGPLFKKSAAREDDERLLGHGVLPRSAKRRVFEAAFTEVLLPGLERVGIEVTSARAWRRSRSEEG